MDDKISIGNLHFDSEELITFDEIFIGDIPKLKNIDVEIKTNEGNNIPHIHVSGNNPREKMCIMLFEPKYFDHGKYTWKFSNKRQCKVFDDFMRQSQYRDRFKKTMTNWEYAKEIWIEVHGLDTIYFNIIEQPDYTELK